MAEPKVYMQPNFDFIQGDMFQDDHFGYPIKCVFYEDTISLYQNGNELLLSKSFLDSFCKQLKAANKEISKLKSK